MQIGEVIRKHRKECNLTQEEMARRLGVTTPAVNKWENGNSYPDILLLAPIARLLNISLETLMSFHEELTDEEINSFVKDMNLKLKNEKYDDVYRWARSKVEMYPNCEKLIWQIAAILDVNRLTKEVEDSKKYDDYILECYICVLNSKDETLRTHAADSLFHYYSRKEQYDEAEKYLKYFSEQNPERKRKQALIYSKTNRIEEAYKAYEELLFSGYQMTSMVLNSIYMLAVQDKDMKKAHKLVDKQQELAKLFEMGKYHEVSCRLDLAVLENDKEAVQEIKELILSSVEEICSFTKSSLYEHMTFKEVSEEFKKEMKENLQTLMNKEV